MAFTISGTSGLTFPNATTQTAAGVLTTSTQLCKAWIFFNGNTDTILASYNVSSITRQPGISWDVNFTSAMANTNYSCCGSTSDDGVGLPAFGESGGNNGNRTTSKVRVILGGGVTRTMISVAIFSS